MRHRCSTWVSWTSPRTADLRVRTVCRQERGGPGRRRAGYLAHRTRAFSPAPRGEACGLRPVTARRVQRPEVGQPARIDVHTPRSSPVSSPTVQLAVQAGQHLLPHPADRASGQGNQIKITDTRDVIPGGQGTGHQQIGHPAKAVQTIRKMTHDRRHVGHPASLRPRITEFEISRPMTSYGFAGHAVQLEKGPNVPGLGRLRPVSMRKMVEVDHSSCRATSSPGSSRQPTPPTRVTPYGEVLVVASSSSSLVGVSITVKSALGPLPVTDHRRRDHR